MTTSSCLISCKVKSEVYQRRVAHFANEFFAIAGRENVLYVGSALESQIMQADELSISSYL
jgi:hypothetical protein